MIGEVVIPDFWAGFTLGVISGIAALLVLAFWQRGRS